MFSPYRNITVPVYSQVGWVYNGALYCLRCEPEPYLQSHADRVEPVLRCDVQSDDACDNCRELLD